MPTLNRSSALLCFLILSCFCVGAFAASITVTRKTTVMKREAGKIKPLASVEADSVFPMRRVVAKGKWIEIEYRGKVAYIKATATNYSASRSVSSTSTSEAGYRPNKVVLKAAGEFVYGLSSLGVGFGGRFTGEIPYFTNPRHRLEVAGLFTYFPSVGGLASVGISATSMMFAGLGRFGYRAAESVCLGLEAGGGYLSASISSGTTTASASGFLMAVGGFADFDLTPSFGLISGVRFLIASGSILTFYGGLQYAF
jgi:hypothetical protein